MATSEYIPIYGPRCLRSKEAPALAGGPCTGLPSCLPAFLDSPSMTVAALQRLVPAFGPRCTGLGDAARPPEVPGTPRTLVPDK